jgi:hypothetical protein
MQGALHLLPVLLSCTELEGVRPGGEGASAKRAGDSLQLPAAIGASLVGRCISCLQSPLQLLAGMAARLLHQLSSMAGPAASGVAELENATKLRWAWVTGLLQQVWRTAHAQGCSGVRHTRHIGGCSSPLPHPSLCSAGVTLVRAHERPGSS